MGWLCAWTPAEAYGMGTPSHGKGSSSLNQSAGKDRMASPGQGSSHCAARSKCLGKEAAAFGQGFGKEFQKVLGVASLFLEQIKSWALLGSVIRSRYSAKFLSGARGAERS